MKKMKEQRFVSNKELAEIFGVSLPTIYNWIKGGYIRHGRFIEKTYEKFPAPARIGNMYRHDMHKIEKWAKSCGLQFQKNNI